MVVSYKLFKDCANRVGYIFVALTIIFICWIKITSHLELYLDIFFADEANYMYRGTHPSELIGNAENGPIYSLWYYILNFFEKDPVGLYFLNWKLMILMPSISLFILLFSFNVNVFIATILSITFLWADPTFLQWPRVSNFCISIIAIGLSITTLNKNLYYKFFVLVFTALITSYIRPEYFITFLILTSGLIIFLIFNYKNTPVKVYYGLITLIIILFVLKSIYQWPMFENGYRSFIAFAQYYAVYYFSKNNIYLNPWTQWEPCFRENFGNANSLSQALLNNPKAFLEMLSFNMSFFANRFYRYMPEFIYSSRIFPINLVFGIFLLYFIILYSGIFYVKNRSFIGYFKNTKINGNIILGIILFIIPPLIACIIYYPRDHYMYLIVIPLILIFCLVFNADVLFKFKGQWANYCLFLILAVGLFYGSLNTEQYFYGKRNQPYLATINAIKSLNTGTKAINTLDEEGLYVFLNPNFQHISVNSKNTDFNSFLLKNNIDIIWATPNLLNHPNFSNDSLFKVFLEEPNAYNFRRVNIDQTINYLLIRNSLN